MKKRKEQIHKFVNFGSQEKNYYIFGLQEDSSFFVEYISKSSLKIKVCVFNSRLQERILFF